MDMEASPADLAVHQVDGGQLLLGLLDLALDRVLAAALNLCNYELKKHIVTILNGKHIELNIHMIQDRRYTSSRDLPRGSCDGVTISPAATSASTAAASVTFSAASSVKEDPCSR